MNNYLEMLKKPDSSCKGKTRWWWYGCAVTKEDVVRELDFMKEASIGGVELQILYSVEPDDVEKGIYNIPYGSPEFFEILKFTALECKKRDMTFDFTPGSSWPYGGPMITKENAMQSVIPYTIDVCGPCKFDYDFTTRFAGEVCAATMGKMENCKMIPETIVNITDKVVTKYLFGWPWGEELKSLDIPEGNWKLTFFLVYMHRNYVGKPSRNAEGMVMDHCSKEAMSAFWSDMVKPISDRVPNINSFFCDSIEVEGHNWSKVLLGEFKKRRGYDLSNYIYALWGEIDDITSDVRYDYFKTMGELTYENFFRYFNELCKEANVTSRIQAHGTWGDILKIYAAADIPEGETFSDFRRVEVNTIHRRLAVSAGHVYDKNVISNETFTWLCKPRFFETPEILKDAVDSAFLDGVNLIFNHGYSHAPERFGKLGIPFYASCQINHTQPWWKHYKLLGDYIWRTSAMLQKGKAHVEVAIYLPQMDIYANNPMSELHMAMKLEEHLETKCVDAIQKAGYWFDYINDEAFEKEINYGAIILIGCKRLPVKTAQALYEYAKKGGIIIACEEYPELSCGLIDKEKNYETVKEYKENAIKLENVYLTENKFEALIKQLKSLIVPDVSIEKNENIGYVHRIDKENHIYFFANISYDNTITNIRFKDRNEGFEILDAVTQESINPISVCYDEKGCTINTLFKAHHSYFIVFSNEIITKDAVSLDRKNSEKNSLIWWDLKVDGDLYEIKNPCGWEKFKPCYTGFGEYITKVNVNANNKKAVLKFENLSCVAEVFVNGSDAGVLWLSPFEIDITKFLECGENEIKVIVYSRLINEIFNPKLVNERVENIVGEWPYFGNVINNQRDVRLEYSYEMEQVKEPVPCGIYGEVTIIFER